eukprot:SAG31_NODE_1646_length_7649_cov_3.317616_11_plen_125_part_00
MDAGHVQEKIAYMAAPQGRGEVYGATFEAIKTPDAVTHRVYGALPKISRNTSKCIRNTSEISGNISDVNFERTFAQVPAVFASIATYDGSDPAHLRLEGQPTRSGCRVFIEEEICTDQELEHTT